MYIVGLGCAHFNWLDWNQTNNNESLSKLHKFMGKGQMKKVFALNILPHKLLDIYNVGKKGVTNRNLFHNRKP